MLPRVMRALALAGRPSVGGEGSGSSACGGSGTGECGGDGAEAAQAGCSAPQEHSNAAATRGAPAVATVGAGARSLAKARAGAAAARNSDVASGAPTSDAAPIYYVHTKHRYDVCDMHFFEQCAAAGLAVEEVWEPGAERPPPSPPPLSELFPDMRCAVFLITVLHQ